MKEAGTDERRKWDLIFSKPNAQIDDHVLAYAGGVQHPALSALSVHVIELQKGDRLMTEKDEQAIVALLNSAMERLSGQNKKLDPKSPNGILVTLLDRALELMVSTRVL